LYEQQQLRSEITDEHERKMSSMRHELEELNENEECQFMDSLNVSKFNMTEELRRKDSQEQEINKLKESHQNEMTKLKKRLDEELDELRKKLQTEVRIVFFFVFWEMFQMVIYNCRQNAYL